MSQNGQVIQSLGALGGAGAGAATVANSTAKSSGLMQGDSANSESVPETQFRQLMVESEKQVIGGDSDFPEGVEPNSELEAAQKLSDSGLLSLGGVEDEVTIEEIPVDSESGKLLPPDGQTLPQQVDPLLLDPLALEASTENASELSLDANIEKTGNDDLPEVSPASLFVASDVDLEDSLKSSLKDSLNSGLKDSLKDEVVAPDSVAEVSADAVSLQAPSTDLLKSNENKMASKSTVEKSLLTEGANRQFGAESLAAELSKKVASSDSKQQLGPHSSGVADMKMDVLKSSSESNSTRLFRQAIEQGQLLNTSRNIQQGSQAVMQALNEFSTSLSDLGDKFVERTLPGMQILQTNPVSYRSVAGAVVASALVQPQVGTPQWGQAVAERMVWFNANHIASAELHLDPPDLGPLQVRINSLNDQTSISFTSQHQVVREALDQSLPRLREIFAENGLNLADVDVSEQGTGKDQNSEDNQLSDASGSQDGVGSGNETEAEINHSPSVSLQLQLIDAYA